MVRPRLARSPLPANSSVFLNTLTVPGGPNILILEVDGIPVAISESDVTRCPLPPMPSPPPTGTGGTLPGLPNTGTGPDSIPPGDGRLAATLGALALLGTAAVVGAGWRRRHRGQSA